MTRRDTIIVAVLLNAGLLIVLFATSMKSESIGLETQTVAVAPPVKQEAVGEVAQMTAVPPLAVDEVEQKAQQYVPPVLAPQTSNSSAAPNFTADLQAITTPPQETVVAKETFSELEQSFKEIKVKKGDVLERIARQHHVTVDDIMKANQLHSPRLKIGQTLKIPAQNNKRSQQPTSVDVASATAQYYTVKNGDNPWTIAVKHRMKVEELLKINNIDEEKARHLKPGDRIRIR